MKQVYQSYRTGELAVVEVPEPMASRGRVLVRTVTSLVSVGTERSMIELARKSLLGKAMARPDLVRQVVNKVRAEGLAEAYRQASGRLDTPVALGYSSAGLVVEAGADVAGFAPGDHVACVGPGFAGHAEMNVVPINCCVRMPEPVGFEAAAFAALGGIALEAVRVAHVGLGDRVVVIGLGLLGQLAVQILRAAGCHVFGTDLVAGKVAMARQYGAEAGVLTDQDVPARVQEFTRGHGADAVIILASGGGNQALELAAELARERARIVATGLVGLDVPRQVFYDKELELVVSRAWGPGLYDPNYTERGLDYPLPHARWTAGRNVDEFLELVARGTVRVEHLITHRFPIDRAVDAYDLITKGSEPYLGVLLTYPDTERRNGAHAVSVPSPVRRPSTSVTVGLIGAGVFARGTLLPAMKGIAGLDLQAVATATPLTGRDVATRAGFRYATTDYRELLADDAVNAVLIATRHGLHAQIVVEALQAGKHVFVEKPLALSREELESIAAARRAAPDPVLMVGFNRRFSPFTVKLAGWLADIEEPSVVHCRVNAGSVAADSWVHDSTEGGGRILGEMCHFVDLAQVLCRSDPVRVQADTLQSATYLASDNVAATVRFGNGSLATILYAANGDKSFSRERVEVFSGGAVGVIDNFRSAAFRARGREQKMSRPGVDRGHHGELEAFFVAVKRGGPSPVTFESYAATTLATFGIEEALRTGRSVAVDAREVMV